MASQPADDEIEKWQRWFAADSNNRGWKLAELAQRTPAQTEEMLHAAHAAALLWGRIGTELNIARAHMLLGHAHGLAGNGALAMRYAQASLDYFALHESPDWEIAFAHAVMACAAHAAGDAELHGQHFREAARRGDALGDPEDKQIFMSVFRRVPAPGH